MFVIHLPHLAGFLAHLPHLSALWKALLFLLPLQLDPMSTIMALMNQLGGFFNTQNQQNMQQDVYGAQMNAMKFMQDPSKMNQFMTALQNPYAFGNVATPGTAQQTSQYLQGMQTPYAQMLAQQNPAQMNSLINQYTQGLNSGLTSGVWNATQGQLAGSGLTQAPGVAQYAYAQALGPLYQQNQQLAAQLAQKPLEYGLAEQRYGLEAGQLPLNYGLTTAGMGIQEAQEALKYPLSIGSGLAGQFPNYQWASGTQ